MTPWLRTHPMTLVIELWPLLGGVATLSFLWLVGGSSRSAQPTTFLLLAAATVAVQAMSWWRHEYRLTDTALERRSGLLRHVQQQAPVNRVQTVDLNQPFMGRLLGYAAVHCEVIGGRSSNLVIGYLKRATAEQLRADVLARQAPIYPGAPPDAPRALSAPPTEAPPDAVVIPVPITRQVAALATGGPGILTLVTLTTIVLAVTPVRAQLPWLPAVVLPLLMWTGGIWWRSLTHGGDMYVALAADGLRIRRGITDRTWQTIPTDRIQAVRLHQPLWWRPWGWWRVDANIAGYTGDTSEVPVTVLLPVGRSQDGLAVASLIVPDLGNVHADELMSAALNGQQLGSWFTLSPREAWWLSPWGYRYAGWRVTTTALVLRHGRWNRSVTLVPHGRAQSTTVHQNLTQRWLGLVDIQVPIAIGPVRPVATNVGLGQAQALVDEVRMTTR